MESSGERPTLLIIKGSFSQYGGAERDIVRQLEALQEFFHLRIATLSSHPELESETSRLEIPLFVSESEWSESQSAFSRIMASRFGKKSYKENESWKSICLKMKNVNFGSVV